MRKRLKHQRGSLLIAAIVLIVIVGFFAATVSYLSVTSSESTINQIDSKQAFYIANAGLERAKQKLLTTTLSDRIACDQVTGNADLTNISFAGGRFTVTGSGVSPGVTPTLAAHISAVATIIPVSSVSGLTGGGRVMIDKELIDYASTSTVSATCGGAAPCMIGATRGVGGSNNVAHQTGSFVTQSECALVSNGYLPDASNPVAHRQVSNLMLQLGDGWVTGNKHIGEVFAQWNGAFWSIVTPTALVPDKDMYGIESITNEDVWAVGDKSSGALTVHWNGTNWQRISASALANQNLRGISCTASNDCWAVGGSRTFGYWNGTSWQAGNVKTNGTTVSGKVPNKTINAVSCVGSSDCWAVGDSEGGDALFVRWNGIQWKRVLGDATVPDKNLSGVSCAASSDCWAVGAKEGGDGLFVHWNGSTWSRVTPVSASNKDFNAVYCVSGSDCWAVGQNGYMFHWNGANWSASASGTGNELRGLDCSASANCWAVGNSTTVLKWDGSSWAVIAAPSIPNITLRGVVAITGVLGADSLKFWQEI